ncbi:MAG: hypothetical protein AAFR38_14320 [Planctomycetota bacterium]
MIIRWTFAAIGLVVSGAAAQLGPPAGPVTPTMKPLDAIEPRRCIGDLPGDEGAVVLITEPGSYFLDADLVGEPGKHGIRIVTPGSVKIDLKGFDLIGGPGSLNGIDMDLGPTGVLGSQLQLDGNDGASSEIRGWEGDGVRTSGVIQCECTHLISSGNGGNGLTHLHAEGVIHRDIAARNNLGHGTEISHSPLARPGVGVTNRFATCRARSNGGGGVFIYARAHAYNIDFSESLACGNGGDGVCVFEDRTLVGPSVSPGTVTLHRVESRDNTGDGVRHVAGHDSCRIIRTRATTCVGNGGDGLDIDVLGAEPFFGATCTIDDSVFSNNGGNGVRSSNPLHVSNTTCGENALYGARVSGGDANTMVLQTNVCHFAANSSGGARCDRGRFSDGTGSYTDNGGPGIETGDGCLLLNGTSVTNNAGPGVLANGTLNVVSSNMRRNAGPGVSCTNGEVVAEDVVCEFNGSSGATGGMVFLNCPSVTLRRCVSNGNTGDGVRASSNVGPVRWMSPEMMVSNNTGGGMVLDSCVGARLERCVSSGNGGGGYVLRQGFTKGRVSGCSSSDDKGGGFFVSGTGNLIMGCSADGSAAGAFNILPGNLATPIVDAATLPTNRVPDPNIIY